MISNVRFRTYNQFRCVLDQSCRKKRRVILGVDFNTIRGVGIRGLYLQHVANDYSLKITNESNEPWID